MPNLNDFPAIDGRTVTEAHATMCRVSGHAHHMVDGRPSTMCPRCGETVAPSMGEGTEMLADYAAGLPVVQGAITGRYDVAYSIDIQGYAPGMTTVVLTDGYTDESDIPQIIALTRGVKAHNVHVIAVESVDNRLPEYRDR